MAKQVTCRKCGNVIEPTMKSLPCSIHSEFAGSVVRGLFKMVLVGVLASTVAGCVTTKLETSVCTVEIESAPVLAYVVPGYNGTIEGKMLTCDWRVKP